MNRVILIVLDSVGIGELPDAKEYGDEGSNTLGNIVKVCGDIDIPNMCALGLGKVEGINYLEIPDVLNGSYGRMAEVSKGKDTITGHWEIAGIQLEQPFPLYPQGFPESIIEEFKRRIGTDILGNYAASGTEIIKDLGDMHMRTGFPIVYTSGDSVFQIAAHEDVIPIDRLYEMCKIARGILTGAHAVGRVVARPFIGEVGHLVRTGNRRDFAISPILRTILDELKENYLDVIAIGKIEDIYSGIGITEAVHTRDNMHGVDLTLEYMQRSNRGLIFTNLVDFDMLYGHRNDHEGYKKALEEFDLRLPEIYSNMRDEDLLIITADHGCDPVTPSTDHSREYVPLMLWGKTIRENVNLGTRSTFSDIAYSIAEIFGIIHAFPGESFMKLIE
ncbi:MAG TPA: phosphopentomutase [Ruminiclostridium sp.]